jgi:hypothetical protein
MYRLDGGERETPRETRQSTIVNPLRRLIHAPAFKEDLPYEITNNRSGQNRTAVIS